MKAFVELGGLLLLLVFLIWTCSGQEPVLVECSYFNFRAVAKRALFCREEIVGPDELFLGTGCPATQVQQDELVFDYPTSLCGITTQVFADGAVIYSRLIYVSRNLLISAELLLECTVSRSYVPPDKPPVNISLKKRFPLLFPGQHWFYVQHRLCVRCGHPHIRDNWSMPFYGPQNYSLLRHPLNYQFEQQYRSNPVLRCHVAFSLHVHLFLNCFNLL